MHTIAQLQALSLNFKNLGIGKFNAQRNYCRENVDAWIDESAVERTGRSAEWTYQKIEGVQWESAWKFETNWVGLKQKIYPEKPKATSKLSGFVPVGDPPLYPQLLLL